MHKITFGRAGSAAEHQLPQLAAKMNPAKIRRQKLGASMGALWQVECGLSKDS
jgi:hypothetical protein